MNKSNPKTSERNTVKLLIYSLIIFILAILTITQIASILGFFSGSKATPISIVVFALEISATVALFIVIRKFFRSVDTVNSQAELLAHGELNISDILPEKARGLEILTIAFNDMKSNLLSFIELTKCNIITISDAIDSVSKSMNNTFVGNEQIAKSMGSVAEKAQEQSKFMGDTMAKIDEVGHWIENITNSIEEVEKSVEKTVHATNTGVDHLDRYYQQVNTISDNLNSTSEYIKQLNSDITQIDQIGKIIVQISEQLKLLGLNASVEAAKAGESGKGFAVVAHEMNLLSAATKESISRINSILKNIDRSSSHVSSSIDNCVASYDISKEIFKSIKESFEIINNSAGVLESDMKKVYSDVYRINTSTHDINEKSLLLYQTSEEISNKTQEVAAVTQEELAELEEISNYTASLQKMLTGIENLVRRFHTSVAPTQATSSKQLRIAFVSPLDHQFWYSVRQGVLYSQKELAGKNAVIEYFGFRQDVGTGILKTVKECIENGFDGIVAPGFDTKLADLIEIGHQKGIPFMIYNCDLSVKSKRIAYFGPDVSSSGPLAARLMVKALDGKGDIVILRGGLDFSVHKTRRDTIIAELKKNKHMKLFAEVQSGDDNDLAYAEIKDLLKRNSNIRGIITTGGAITGPAKAIEELGLTGKTYIICFDYNKEIYEYINKGIIYSAIGQDPFGQGHDPVIYLYNMLVTGQKPENEIIWTRLDVVDKNNVNDLL